MIEQDLSTHWGHEIYLDRDDVSDTHDKWDIRCATCSVSIISQVKEKQDL